MKRIELHAKSKYSLDNQSTIDIKNLILKCVENGERGVGIVDRESVIGLIKAEKILKELKIKDFKLVYGVEIKVRDKNWNEEVSVVVLLKNKNGIRDLYKELSYYGVVGFLMLDNLIRIRDNLILGLVYDNNSYSDEIIKYFDYIEVDNMVSREVINELKKKTIVVYSNRINALSCEEELSQKILYNQLKIKKEVNTRVYKSTDEVIKEIKDEEIVIDNPNKIFDMIERIELIADEMKMPINNGFDIGLLVYIKLQEKYGDNIPSKIRKRVDEELKLISELNYEGYIDIYREITNKCKEENEEYVIEDYVSYLYIAYLLGITHFDPIKMGYNYDVFFSSQLMIRLKVSLSFRNSLLKFIEEELRVKTIKCKKFMKLNGGLVNRAIEKYEECNNIKLDLDDKTKVMEYLDDYLLNRSVMTFKEIVISTNFDILTVTPYQTIISDEKMYQKCLSIDYKDIENKFMIIELLPNEDIDKLNELKEHVEDKIKRWNYKDKNIVKSKEYQKYLDGYKDSLILDDVYDELINSKIELPDVFNVINEIRNDGVIAKNTKEILNKNNIKLSRYHNINFLSRGILNERIRLIYELLYFKVYYPLEYYYVMIKGEIFFDLLDIIRGGYDEVVKELNNYKEYRYEYRVLNMFKELYDLGIGFRIEERDIKEGFYLGMNKERNEINLIIKNKNKLKDNNLNLIGTRPMNGKMQFLSKIVTSLLNEKEGVTLFGLSGVRSYYLEYVLENIINIDRKVIRQYLNMCASYETQVWNIDKDKYIEGIKYLIRNDLVIRDYHMLNDMIIDGVDTLFEKMSYIINREKNKIIIIDGLEYIDDELDMILDSLKKLSNKNGVKFIIFTNLKRSFENDNLYDISSFENSLKISKYMDYVGILNDGELKDIKII